jgi:uncharacterized protein (UPF0332 family)
VKKASEDLWSRALDSLNAARALLDISPDAAASRAYYTAFYAASSYFMYEGRSFSKHSAVEAAVHRNLVRAGLLPNEVGAAYSKLIKLREVGDYGGGQHVSEPEARVSVQLAELFFRAIQEIHPVLQEPPASS